MDGMMPRALHGLHTVGLHAEFVHPPPQKSAAHLVHYADRHYFTRDKAPASDPHKFSPSR